MTKNICADGLLIASVASGNTDYYHEDALGSVILVSTSTLTTLFYGYYGPYGGLYGTPHVVTFQYTGKMEDR